MQNPLQTQPFTTHSHLSQLPTNQQDMQDHFNHLLGQSTSRYTAAETQIIPTTNEQTFHSSRMFVIGTLESWGMKMGTLQYSKDNQLTVKCLLQLISQKQRNVKQKIKAKEQLAAVNFEKEKYQSLLKQSKNALLEKDKILGKLQNQCAELRKKIRLIEGQAKKQKAQDQKVIFMLKSKNQQILHEIKKKQAQVNRIKQQMKRNVLSKSTPLTKTQTGTNPPSTWVKNSYQLIQKIERTNPSKWKKTNITERHTTTPNYADNFEQDKFTFMLEKYQKQKKIITSENTLLRGKVFDIRQVLLKFAQWIDVELFGQNLQHTRKMLQKKFICNHNLMFSKDALMSDLVEVINQAKHGIQQLQQKLQETQNLSSQKSLESPMKKKGDGQSLKIIGGQNNGVFKKKSVSIRETGTPGKIGEGNGKSQKTISSGNGERQRYVVVKSQFHQQPQRHVQQARKPTTHPQKFKSPQHQKNLFPPSSYPTQSLPSQIRPTKFPQPNQLQLSIFQNDILSDIYQHSVTQDADNSIVSHISTSEFVKELYKGQKGKKDKYDKWDILFRTEGDEEQQ